MLADKIDAMLKAWDSATPSLQYKEDLFCINEGSLYDFIVKELARTLGAESKSFQYAVQRIPPINVLRKIISKLTQIYSNPPSRLIVDGNESDQQMLDYYVQTMSLNSYMDVTNEFYNLTKVGFAMPYFDALANKHFIKVLLPHQFLPFANDPNNRSKMTELMTYQGTFDEKKHFYAYSDYEFIHFDEDGKQYPTLTEGVNIYGAIPGAYVRRSRNLFYPKDDTDMKTMTVLIPTMLADLNLASMFSCFSIMYGIDITDEDRKFSPLAFWHLRSPEDSNKKPEIGTIKPEADIDQTINLIVSEFSMWLNSKGIKPGSIGQINVDSVASGISKIIDEMETFEDRKKQAEVFSQWEANDLWPLIMHKMHPVWIAQGMQTNKMFTPTAKVAVEFPEQRPMKSRAELVAEYSAEVSAGFLSRQMAIKALNPNMSDEEIAAMVTEINEPATVEI
jgi:hypothetical protein